MEPGNGTMTDSLTAKRDRLLELIGSYASCAVAYSGGVDSAVVAKAAQLALGDRAVAVTARSPSLADGELTQASDLARRIGIRHVVIDTRELDQPEYVRNAPDRCYHCKTELYTQMESWNETFSVAEIANGANADDVGDYRPGMQAAREHRIRSPLLECGINKAEVRELAAHWHLPVAAKPASPCLSSRIAYGEPVTPERLAMIDLAETFLRESGFRNLRVRYHHGDLARIEVPVEELANLVDSTFRQRLVIRLGQLGFKFITLDLVGFRSGSLNALLPNAGNLVSLGPVDPQSRND
jgi:uncharacterized protein